MKVTEEGYLLIILSTINRKDWSAMNNYRTLSMKVLLEEISARQANQGLEKPMEGLRSVFEPGDKSGDIFVALLNTASQQGLICGVTFIPKGSSHPEEAIWDDARLTFAGKIALSQLRT